MKKRGIGGVRMFVETAAAGGAADGFDSFFEDIQDQDDHSQLLLLAPCRSSRFCKALFPPRTMLLPMHELENTDDDRIDIEANPSTHSGRDAKGRKYKRAAAAANPHPININTNNN